MDLIALWHVESSWIKDQTRVFCIDRWIFFFKNTEPPGKLSLLDSVLWSTKFLIFTKSNVSSFSLVACVSGVISKKMWPCLRSQSFMLIFSSKSFLFFSSYILRYFLHMVGGRSLTSCFCMWMSNCPNTACWKTILSLSNGFGVLVQNQLPINVGVQFWTLSSVLFICICLALCQISHGLDCCSFVVKFWNWEVWVLPCSSFSKLFWLFWVPCISIWVVELRVTAKSHRLWQGRGPDALLTEVPIVKVMVFPIVTYICESWSVKKTGRWRIDVFKLWCWRRCLRVPWTAKGSNQSILKSALNIHWKNWFWSCNPLATWCEELTYWKRPWCWERLRTGGEGGSREWDGWMASLIQWA